MSNKQVVRDIIALSVKNALARPDEDASAKSGHGGGMMIYPMALCYATEFEGNTLYHDDQLMETIIRLGDTNCSVAVVSDEWTHITWMEAADLMKDEIDEQRLERWKDSFFKCADHLMSNCVDMDVFDGGIPNHGIWYHTYVYRTGQLYGIDKYTDMAKHAMGRIIAGQTPDGCWAEGQSDSVFKGSPVTSYNSVSAMAINLYYSYSGDAKALKALDKAWDWFYGYLLPDYTKPPTLDSRQPYSPDKGMPTVAHWWNKPEGRYLGILGAERQRENLRSGAGTGTGFLALQYPLMEEDVEEKKPTWPEYKRMVREEACIHRQNDWAVVLSGMTNKNCSNSGLRLFQQERQDCVSIAHEKTGLIVGSAHSQIEEQFSTFVVYEDGAAIYLPESAYLKSTPPLDTLLLKYGSNTMAVSVDTTNTEHADITLSLHGERGSRPERGRGHPISAMGARAHLCMRLTAGDTLTLGDRSFAIEEDDEQILRLDVPSGEVLSNGIWSLSCAETAWEFRWPVRTRNPYHIMEPGEWIGLVEVILTPTVFGLGSPGEGGCPTATFSLGVV